MNTITLGQAQTIIAGAFAKGDGEGFKPLTVAVLDAGGHLIAVARQDGSSAHRPGIAIGKASGVIGLRVSSRTVGEMAADRPTFIASLGQIAPHGMIPAAGGVLVAGDGGDTIGAFGVTGDVSDNDEICAIAGIETAGLTAQS